MKKLKRMTTIIGILGITALMFTGCGASSASSDNTGGNEDEKIVIRTSYFTPVPWSYPLFVADEVGITDEIFKDYNVEFEFSGFLTGPETNEAVVGGNLDFIVGIGDQPFLTGIENGVPTTMLTTMARQEKTQILVAKANSDINSAADLKGKTIAVGIGQYTHKSLIGILADNNIDINDVDLVNFSTAGDVVSAIERGDVDVYLGSLSDLSSSIEEGKIKQIGDVTGHPANTYLVGANSFIEEYPELTQKVVEALYEGNQFIKEHPEEAYPIIAENTGVDIEILEQVLPLIDMNEDFTDADFEQLNITEDFLLENDFISEKNDNLQDYIDSSFIKNVIESREK